uniref:Transcription factor bHLH147 n=1 Tax=Anthurium amnicola TaxID=1678845 RepID=A0A1D1XL66_9ARAE
MQPTASFKLAFLRHMLVGLRQGGASSGSTSILERKRAVKLTADMAMAVARGSRRWSRALVADLSRQDKTKALARCIMGEQFERLSSPHPTDCRASTCKKILRRSFRVRSKIRKRPPAPRRAAASASLLAKRMVKKRTQVLKRLVPGGESLDDLSLLEETRDYIVCLRAQVDLMQRLTNALGQSKRSGSQPACGRPEKEDSCVAGETLKA